MGSLHRLGGLCHCPGILLAFPKEEGGSCGLSPGSDVGGDSTGGGGRGGSLGAGVVAPVGVPVSPLVSLVGDRDTTLHFWTLPVTVALGTVGTADTSLTTGWTLGTVVVPGEVAHGHGALAEGRHLWGTGTVWGMGTRGAQAPSGVWGPWGDMGQCGTRECGRTWGQSGAWDMGLVWGHGDHGGTWGGMESMGTVWGYGDSGGHRDMGTVWRCGDSVWTRALLLPP